MCEINAKPFSKARKTSDNLSPEIEATIVNEIFGNG